MNTAKDERPPKWIGARDEDSWPFLANLVITPKPEGGHGPVSPSKLCATPVSPRTQAQPPARSLHARAVFIFCGCLHVEVGMRYTVVVSVSGRKSVARPLEWSGKRRELRLRRAQG